MSEEKKRESVSVLKGAVPKWGDYFEKRLEFKLSKENTTALVSRLSINCKNDNTVWCNVVPYYPELSPVTAEQIYEFEKCLFGFYRSNKAFYFSLQQIEYMTGRPTLFERQQGATTAFICLLLMQKGQPIMLEKDPRDNRYVSYHYHDYKIRDTTRQLEDIFTKELLRIYEYLITHGGRDLVREVIIVKDAERAYGFKKQLENLKMF